MEDIWLRVAILYIINSLFGENFPSSLTYLFLHNIFESFGSIWVLLQVFSGVRVAQSFVFHVMSCRSLLVIFSFSFWSLYCLSFFYLGLLVTRLVSSSLVLLFSASGYPFGVFISRSSIYGFWLPVWCLHLSFFYLGLLVTRLVSSSLVLLFRASGYPFGVFISRSSI